MSLAAACRVACREHDPVRIQLELRHLRGSKQPVVFVAGLVGWSKYQRRLGASISHGFGLSGQQSVGRKVNDAGTGQRAGDRKRLQGALVGTLAKVNSAAGRAQQTRHCAKLVGRFGQRRLATEFLGVGDAAAQQLGHGRSMPLSPCHYECGQARAALLGPCRPVGAIAAGQQRIAKADKGVRRPALPCDAAAAP